ncbi:hypothetical protein M011DRAFT_459167 [Sporormia fimetaria CBS 119925]|uniref:Uncharacterized protein n=1 Tax=Sporormia fimetaria CBS 119925 TaxID=1340428 RepID=A0A6A6V841_9PLEO|nr:hypothetical protein M011DRAFT_459167 [Sporormia fimetaria CBS 119925]
MATWYLKCLVVLAVMWVFFVGFEKVRTGRWPDFAGKKTRGTGGGLSGDAEAGDKGKAEEQRGGLSAAERESQRGRTEGRGDWKGDYGEGDMDVGDTCCVM